MDPIQSWLDAKEVRRMAESLMAPAPEVDQEALDAGYGDDFEGFAKSKASEPVSPAPGAPETTAPDIPSPPAGQNVGTTAKIVVSHALADAKRLAEGSGMLSAPEPNAGQSTPASAEDVALNPETMSPPDSPAPPPSEALVGRPVASPFQLSEDQSPCEGIPIARQVSPPPMSPPYVAPAGEISHPATEGPAQAKPEETGSASPAKAAIPPDPPKPRPASGGARGPFLTRLKKFSALLRERTGAKAMFLIDNEGQILIDEVGNTKLIQVARTLANASHAATRQTAGAADVGNLHVKIGASATLEVIPCRSRYGLLILGVVCPAPMGAERVKQVADYLAKTVEPSGGV